MNPGFDTRSHRARGLSLSLLVCALSLTSASANAQDAAAMSAPADELQAPVQGPGTSGKLLLTGGVTQVEGSAGAGLAPWAVIGGYGTDHQVGANAFYTRIALDDYRIDSYGVLVGLYDRVELSVSRQSFDTQHVGALLGLGSGFRIRQDTYGVKVKLVGDAVLEQDSWMPQVSIGAQYKRNDEGALLSAIGARDDHGTDLYLTATKLYLGRNLLLNATVRYTDANQLGILGFGGDRHRGRTAQFESSAAYLLSRSFAIGAEYRSKPDNLKIASEDDAYDLFVAWAPLKNVSLTVAYVDLGNIVIRDHQRGLYGSLQVGF